MNTIQCGKNAQNVKRGMKMNNFIKPEKFLELDTIAQIIILYNKIKELDWKINHPRGRLITLKEYEKDKLTTHYNKTRAYTNIMCCKCDEGRYYYSSNVTSI